MVGLTCGHAHGCSIPAMRRTMAVICDEDSAVLLAEVLRPPDAPPLFVMSHMDGTTCEPLFDRADGGPQAVVA